MRRNRIAGAVLAALALVASAATARADVEAGKAAYEQRCRVCHSIAGDRGSMADKGGPLDRLGAKRDAAYLKAYLQDPKSKKPDAKMPRLKLDDRQLEDLVAFLQTLR